MAYKLFEINDPKDLDAIVEYLDEAYEPQFVIDQLKRGLDARCKKVLLEDSYNDKDYRSTYYHYYAKKGYRYGAHCARLHFFDDRVSLIEKGAQLRFDVTRPEQASETYFGFMVLRPTRLSTIGRTVITPAAITGFHGELITSSYKVHLLGHKLTVKGFPYMSQHQDIAVCAHVACWAILRHYSERFSKYAEYLTHDITRMAHEFDPGGLLPSAGLHVHHAERVFSSAGAFPFLLFKEHEETHEEDEDFDEGLFYRQMLAYVESGFPLFAEIKRIGHAVAVVGHTGFRSEFPQSAPCHFANDVVNELVVVDDNCLPYHAIPIGQGNGDEYGRDDITAFIVPLPEKIYYPAEYVDKLAMILATRENLGFNHESLGEPVVRYFLTTAAHLRWVMNELRSQCDPLLMNIVMELALPQFVWVIEISSQEQWKDGIVATRAVIDATASQTEEWPIFLMHNSERAYFWDRGGGQQEQFVTLQPQAGAPLTRMDRQYGNLETH